MLGGITLVHVLAFFVRDGALELPLLVLLGLAALIIGIKSLPHGLAIAFAEIFVGGHGHLLAAELFGFSVSLRMALFGAVMLAWLYHVARGARPTFLKGRDAPWLLLFLAVIIAFILGYLRNGFGPAFDDMNGYATILYLLPIITIPWDQTKKRLLLQTLAASVTWILFFTALLGYLFTHLSGDQTNVLYQFVRDARLAEITLQVADSSVAGWMSTLSVWLLGEGDYWFRIFMPSQFFALVGLLICLSLLLIMWRDQKMPVWLSVGTAGLIGLFALHLSRSFLLGVLAGGVIVFFASAATGKSRFRNISKRTVGLVVLAAVGFAAVWALIVIPLPTRPDLSDAAFFSTSSDTGREEAVSSRWNLLGPMNETIMQRPVFGSGFGTEVTYTSDDPRIRSGEETGEYTTYRFEWGWHDVWLKMGLLGLIAFVWLFWSLWRGARRSLSARGHKWLVVGLFGGICALAIVHVFSPYLNHPIGLGYLLFVLPFLDFLDKKTPEKVGKGLKTLQLNLKQPSPVPSRYQQR